MTLGLSFSTCAPLLCWSLAHQWGDAGREKNLPSSASSTCKERGPMGRRYGCFSSVHSNGGQGSQGEMNCTENPRISFEFQPSLPEGPFTPEAAAPLLGFAAPPTCPCSPLAGSNRQPQTFQRQPAVGERRCGG